MPLQTKNKKRLVFLFIAVGMVSLVSFTYLNLCANNTDMIAAYIGEIRHADFRLEHIVLPDLHFFESSFQRVLDIIFTRV